MHGAKNVRCVIQNGIKRLFSDDHTYRIPEVFVFLEGRVLLNVDLHGTVVQTVFLEGAKRHYERWIDYCQAHPAINFLTYGNALVYTGRKNSQHPLFKGLIARSDKDDLKAALSSGVEGSQNDEFRAVIKDALTKADIGGTRLNFPIMTAWMTRRILDKDLNIRMPREIVDTIIVPYITDDQLPARRDMIENVNLGSVVKEGQEGMLMTQFAQLPNLLKELMEDGHHGTVYNIGRRMGTVMLKRQFYPLVTTVKHYVGIYEYLKDNFLLYDFLVNGTEAGVTVAIQGVKKGDKSYLDIDTISTASFWAFNNDNFDRVVCLLGALKRSEVGKAGLEGGEKLRELSTVIQHIFHRMTSMNDLGVRAKHFLVLRGDELDDKHFVIHEAFCKELGKAVRARFTGSQASEFLAVLAQQPIPLSVSALVKGLLEGSDISQVPVCLEGLTWREFHESLIFDDQEKGGGLWEAMKRSIPLKYFGEYPSSAEAYHAFLNRFKFRKELQMEWLLSELDAILKRHDDASCILPFALLSLIAEYIIR